MTSPPLLPLLCLALCLASALATQAILRPQQPIRIAAGQTLVYEYSARLMTGIPSLGDQFAGFELQSLVLFKGLSESVTYMKLMDIKVAKHNGPVPQEFPAPYGGPVMDHQVHAQLQKELQKPIRFVYQDGKVKAFEADQSEPEWSLNMKKGLLSLLNVNLQPKKIIRSPNQKSAFQTLIRGHETELTVYPVYEEGVGGLCETVYELHNAPYAKSANQEPAFVLNVTKTRNYDNCLTEPTIVNDNYDVRGCPWVCRKEKSFAAVKGYFPTPDAVTDPYMAGCPCGKEPHESPVDAFSFAKYNISLIGQSPQIEGVYAEGKTSYATNGDEIMVITQQNLTLAEQQIIQQVAAAQVSIAQIPRPQRHNELSFRIPKPELPKGYKLPLDIPYYHIFGQPDPQELTAIIPELLQSLASDIASEQISSTSEQIGQKTIQLVNAMAVLSQHQLEQLFEQEAQEGASNRATQKQQVVRKLFLDALPLSGSNDAALAIKNLILENKVTTYEAKELVEAVPQNLFLPDLETIDAYLELFQSSKVQQRRHLAASAGIAFGKMVKEACVKRQAAPGDIPDGQAVPHPKRNLPAQMVLQPAAPGNQRVTVTTKTYSQRVRRSAAWESQFTQEVCDEDDVNKYVGIVARLLNTPSNGNVQFHKKVTLIETLAHMGVPQALQVLEPYVSGSAQDSGQCPGYPVEDNKLKAEECDFVRQVAIYALAHIAENFPKQVAPLVLPVYSDQSEAYEVRIAAFTTLIFSAPEKQQLERIASELHQENSRQIRSFVTSALKTVANISAPCFQHVSQHARQASEHAPEAEYGYQYSKMMGHGFYDDQKDFALYSLYEWTSNNVSRVPRAGYVSVGQSSGPFSDELLQVGFQQKGMEKILERIMSPEGVASEMFQSMHARSKDRRVNKRAANSAQQALVALKNELNLETRNDDEPKATIFFKLFDRTSYFALDKHYIHQVIDSAEDSLKEIASELMQGQQFHYVKLVMPSQLYKVVPSEMGLPVVITHRHPLILSLKVDQAKLQLEVEPKTVFPTGGNITAQITPAIYYSSYTFAFAVNPADRQAFGATARKTTHAQFPAEIAVGYSRPKNLLTWSIIPKTTEVIYHESKAQTFVAKAAISGAPDADWLQDAQDIKAMATPFEHEATWGQEQMGIGARVKMTTESPWSTNSIYSGEIYEEQGLVAAVIQAWRNPGLKNREVSVSLESDEETPVQGYDFTLKYKWVEDSENQKDDDDSDESSASDESDSDQSDESSSSDSSESNSSESDSSEESNESSKSSQSSEESDESNDSKSNSKSNNKSKASQLKKRIRNRINKAISEEKSRDKRSISSSSKNKSDKSSKESNESSDESSNESGSKSYSKSGSKESSQSSSSESESSEEKKNNSKNKSKSAQSSESDSSSSSESDESRSFEDNVFDYDDVMTLILGQDFKKREIKKVTKQLQKKTKQVWRQIWDLEQQQQDNEGQSESNQDNQSESDLIPQTIAHDIAITAVARGPRPTYYAANILFAQTYDGRITWFKTDGHIKAPKGVYLTTPTLFCADAVVAFPTLPSEFYFESQQMAQQARLQATVGWGAECRAQGGIIVTGVMEQTEDHVVSDDQFQGAQAQQVQPWFLSQCQVDREEGRAQSYACERAIIYSSYFNQMILDIKYKEIPEEVKNYTLKADLALKVALYEYLDSNQQVDNQNEQIRITAQYSQRVPEIPLANLEIKSPRETQRYEQVHVPYFRPISALQSTARVYANLLTGYQPRDACHVMEDFIRTFDNVTFEIPDSECQFLIAKDCSAEEKFAVFARHLEPELKTKVVTVLTQGQQIELLPPQQQNVAQVLVNGHAHELTFRSPVQQIANEQGANLRIYLRATPSSADNPIIVLRSDIDQLEVTYDGKNAKVQLNSARYSGKTCGLCGDNNDEQEDEFQGPDLCIYEDDEDFANSYALSGQHCEQKPQPKGEKRCPQEENGSSEEDSENSSTIIKNKKVITTAISPNGQTTIVRHEISREQSQQERAQQIQSQANLEELAIKQQQMQERQMARQQGEPISDPIQQQTLVGGSAQTQKLIQRLRTQYIERDEMICFSTKPVLSCVQQVARALQYREVKADFHCLPKSSPFTQQLIQEAQKTVIKQLINKRVDLRQTIQVPVQCVSIN